MYIIRLYDDDDKGLYTYYIEFECIYIMTTCTHDDARYGWVRRRTRHVRSMKTKIKSDHVRVSKVHIVRFVHIDHCDLSTDMIYRLFVQLDLRCVYIYIYILSAIMCDIFRMLLYNNMWLRSENYKLQRRGNI